MFFSFVISLFELGITLAILIITGYLGYWVYFRRYNYWHGKPIKSDSPIPLLGNAVGLLTGKLTHDVDNELYQKYGRLFGSYSGPKPALYVGDPELIKLIFVKDFNHFHTRREFKSGNPLTDNMLSILKGDDKWKNLRNTITPAFATGKLKKMLPLIGQCAETTVKSFKKLSTDGSPIDCKKVFGNYTLDVIANVAFGTNLDSHNDPNNLFIFHAKKVFGAEFSWKTVFAFLMPKLALALGISFFPEDTLQFFKNTVEAIVERRKKNKEEHHDFLQLLVDSMNEDEKASLNEMANGSTDKNVDSVDNIKRKPITKDEFLAQTILFFLAAYDTTATTLTAASYYFATNPERQRKAIEEVDRVWKNRTSIDADALQEAKYLGAAVDETLRLTPPATRLERTCMKDIDLPDTSLTIPSGMIIEVPIYAIHHDGEFFPEPEAFKPERFLDEERSNIDPYTYMPFGAGPRNCVAMRLALMEVKLCLLHILRHFEFSTSDKTQIPMKYANSGLLQPKGVILHVTKRRD